MNHPTFYIVEGLAIDCARLGHPHPAVFNLVFAADRDHAFAR
jgi:hypothetical protein